MAQTHVGGSNGIAVTIWVEESPTLTNIKLKDGVLLGVMRHKCLVIVNQATGPVALDNDKHYCNGHTIQIYKIITDLYIGTAEII